MGIGLVAGKRILQCNGKYHLSHIVILVKRTLYVMFTVASRSSTHSPCLVSSTYRAGAHSIVLSCIRVLVVLQVLERPATPNLVRQGFLHLAHAGRPSSVARRSCGTSGRGASCMVWQYAGASQRLWHVVAARAYVCGEGLQALKGHAGCSISVTSTGMIRSA